MKYGQTRLYIPIISDIVDYIQGDGTDPSGYPYDSEGNGDID